MNGAVSCPCCCSLGTYPPTPSSLKEKNVGGQSQIPCLWELTEGVSGRELCGIFSTHGAIGQTVQPVSEPLIAGVISPSERSQ